MNTQREKIIIRTSILAIISNFILSLFKMIVGIASNSIAIISDAVNNMSDAFSSFITIISTKIANKRADKEHPYGHGRIEYMASLLISSIIIYVGVSTFIEAVRKIIEPVILNYKASTIIVLVAAIFIKFFLGIYVKSRGKKANSTSLVASGEDAFNDAIISISVLLSLMFYFVSKINIESYVACIVSLYIVFTGIKLVKESFDRILGSRVNNSVAKKIKKEIMKINGVHGAFDLILHDYGPDKYLGSVHIEVNDTLKVSDIDRLSRQITKTIKEKYGVILHTIGVYSVNTKDKDAIKIREDISEIVFSHKEILEMHGFFLDKENMTISFDIIIDFSTSHPEKIYESIYNEVKEKYNDYKIQITSDIDSSD